ncbi:MAG TPA: FAD:protein FMN transferase [Polyangiaceae bacterium LLY-WYZ-15_(1-7)]|nr:thiamine biosynthesis protein ApbE [Myxococcales bacterium]MAT25817.1 thiamine biosynthesis protein ApbE [Sandaracinus sp.]HJL05193.1 FAD:protein FMN transferase [Polyangiaceae bacterium LLY-WYZ-15_(1-7)]MBJ72902.1 thiamine biosynthesis protein ApbE [Sandaracinus sp.]HJL08220.1 FAD:protein FMN transferase [Polyangiaceae bacterium LLY-WYZ-15_(1-7)]
MRTPLHAALAALLALACGSDEDEDEVVETVEVRGEDEGGGQPEAEAPPDPDALPPLFSRSRPLMGTVFIIKVQAPERVAAPAVERAFDEIERLETVLSEWREDSEISRINRHAGRRPVEVGEDVFTVVKAGVDVSRWSEGAFDLSWAALRGLYDFRPGRQRVPARSAVRPKLRLIDWSQIELDEEARTVFLKREGMAIGTGGIGKGYALDRAGEILRDAGIESYMLFGGGQVQVHGQRGPRAWRVGIQHPRREEEYFAFFESDGGSISTSGDYEHFFIDDDGKRWHHILDTDTGLPAERTTSVTLLAPSGLYADALSTAVFVLGPERGLEMLARIPYRAEAVVLGADCRLRTTPGTREKLILRVELGEDDLVPGCDAP